MCQYDSHTNQNQNQASYRRARVPNQIGIFQACYIVEIYHSGRPNWHTKLLDTRKVTRLKLLRHESMYTFLTAVGSFRLPLLYWQPKPSCCSQKRVYTFMTKYIQLRCLPCIKQFGMPVCVSCLIYTNGHRVVPFGIGLKGMHISFVGSE